MTYVVEYLKAKIALTRLEQEFRRSLYTEGKQYINRHNILNADGSIPSCIWDIDDNALYIAARNDISKIPYILDISAKLTEARMRWYDIRRNLIENQSFEY